MSGLVIDTSVLAAWVLPDEDGAIADSIIATGEPLIAPFHLPAEIGNVLVLAMRRRRISEVELEEAHATLADLGMQIDIDGVDQVWPAASELARRFKLTVYDALYLELAIRRSLPLASFDKHLLRAAETAGVPLAIDSAD